MSNHYPATVSGVCWRIQFFFFCKKRKTADLKCPPEGMVADFVSKVLKGNSASVYDIMPCSVVSFRASKLKAMQTEDTITVS